MLNQLIVRSNYNMNDGHFVLGDNRLIEEKNVINEAIFTRKIYISIEYSLLFLVSFSH